jgi:hypothetical protein
LIAGVVGVTPTSLGATVIVAVCCGAYSTTSSVDVNIN